MSRSNNRKNDEQHILSLSSRVTSTNYRENAGPATYLPTVLQLRHPPFLTFHSLIIRSLLLVRNLAHLAKTMARGIQRVLELKNLNLSHRPWLANDAERGLVKNAHT